MYTAYSTAEIQEEVKKFASSGSIKGNRNELLQLKAAAKARALELNNATKATGRDFTPDEKIEYGETLSFLNHANTNLDRLAALNGNPGPRESGRGSGIPGVPVLNYDGANGTPNGTPNVTEMFQEAAEFISTGEGGIKASLSEGGGLQFVVPGWEVKGFLAAYPQNQPFLEAGASIFDTDDAHQLNIPIITMGAAPAIIAEGVGPTSEQDASVYVAKLNADKRAFLTKLTEEAAQDIGNIQSVLVAEGVRRVSRAISDACTDALVSSLTAASALTSLGGDYLEALLNLEAAIDTTWASPSNVFMMDRSSLSRFRNTRDLNDKPIFDPTSKTLLSYRVVLNDRCRGKVIFGNFGAGVYLRQTPMIVQRLLELYSEAGKIGIRFQRRSDQAFFSDAATVSQAPQPLYALNVDVGS
jgi:HK97 family phage major capsid protein